MLKNISNKAIFMLNKSIIAKYNAHIGILMQKEELKSLVTQMYDELIANIDSQKHATKDQVVSFLQDATTTIAAIDEKNLDTIEHSKLAFSNLYKEIASSSISSYKDTNEIFEGLTKIHKETIEECGEMHINLPEITEKFNAIQTQMSAEVERANSIITNLSIQVKELEKNSNLDALTKIFNRRALTTYLNNLCERENINYELHLLILDIDDFKLINDNYGHIAGDRILIFIANMLRKTLRDGDKIFRYGGEEFIIILNRINTETCIEVTNRILKLINSNKLIYKGESLKVTMSIGITKFYVKDTPDSIISRADKALYKSKKSGKNQMNVEFITNGN
jgi:diguanylate cyclase (GGDEF)-like protein